MKNKKSVFETYSGEFKPYEEIEEELDQEGIDYEKVEEEEFGE